MNSALSQATAIAAHHANALEATHHASFHILLLERLRYVAAIHGHLLIMKITSSFVSLIDVSSIADVLLLRAQGAHIQVRRPKESAEIIHALPYAVQNVKYVGRKSSDRVLRHLVGRCGIGKMLFVGMEFPLAQSGDSVTKEAWITRAHYVGEKEVGRLLNIGMLRPVITNAA